MLSRPRSWNALIGLLSLWLLGSACGGEDSSSDPSSAPRGNSAGKSGAGKGGSSGKGGSQAEGGAGGCKLNVGCTICTPGEVQCAGNEVRRCSDDGTATEVVETCDVASGKQCSAGQCKSACEATVDSPSNVGCEFWAVDLDNIDYGKYDPASAPWGVVLSNASESAADVLIEINEAPPGQPLALKLVEQRKVAPGTIEQVILPTRELDCGVKPNDPTSPGTCLSSNAYRIRSTTPIVVYQFNLFENSFSNDASLLLPTSALGKWHRIINWYAGHPKPTTWPVSDEILIDRSYVTVVGVVPNTTVKVRPSFRIKGNAPIATTQPGGEIAVVLGPFDVLNLETDNAVEGDPPTDLTGTVVESDQPVAVFSGVEQTGVPLYTQGIPEPPEWSTSTSFFPKDYCCNDHLEEQIFPVESVGTKYVIARSPVRSTAGSYKEPDILRFVGVAETAHVTTTLPAPYNQFTLEPGQVVTTWTQSDISVSADKPVTVGQLLVSQGWVDGPGTGDPALTVFPPVSQYRTEYVVLTPGSWKQNWVVITAEPSAAVSLDGAATDACAKETPVVLDGVIYESRRCPLLEGSHKLSGDRPFGIVMYGYGSAGSYALVGGANVKKTYDPPPLIK